MSEHPHESLAAALAAFQAALPTIPKGATGQVPGKRQHKYADLADLSAKVLPLLAAQGLSFSAKPTMVDGVFGLLYTLRHSSGGADEGFYPLPQGTAWEIGSAITYGRRYCLSAVTGVAADEDDDGHAAHQVAHEGRVHGRGRPPAEPAPAELTPADEARAALRATCTANGYDMAVVANRYKAQSGIALRGEVDAAAIEAFRESLAGFPSHELKAPEPASTNGAAR